MDKHLPTQTDEESPALQGPDYVALVIEWEDLADAFDDATELGTTAAQRSAMATSDKGSDWGSSHASTSAGTPEDISDEVTAPFHAAPRPGHARQMALGVVALAALLSMIEGMRRLRRHY